MFGHACDYVVPCPCKNSTIPLTARLSDSVAPLVKIISFDLAFISAAI